MTTILSKSVYIGGGGQNFPKFCPLSLYTPLRGAGLPTFKKRTFFNDFGYGILCSKIWVGFMNFEPLHCLCPFHSAANC